MDREHILLEDKVELPSSSKIEKFKSKGYVLRSLELMNFFFILSSSIFIFFMAKEVVIELSLILKESLKIAGTLDFKENGLSELHVFLSKSFIKSIVPIFFLIFFILILSAFIQNGFCFKIFLIKPNFSILNPAYFANKIFSRKSLKEGIRFILKTFIIISSLSSSIFFLFIVFQNSYYPNIVELMNTIFYSSTFMFFSTSFIMLLVAVIDYLCAKHSYKKDMMMSRKELQDELKEEEADPIFKSKRKVLINKQEEKRILDSVMSADFLIAGFSRIAVALKYDKNKMKAPILLVKGIGSVVKIMENTAQKHNIPIIENADLAQYLYRIAAIGQSIPKSLYKELTPILSSIVSLNSFHLLKGKEGVNKYV